MKKIIGLDLGTTSIGWAIVNQNESSNEKSAIIKTGIRVNPLTSDEKGQFEKGKSITTNADRTLKRQMRRNLQRYKLRRDNLKAILVREGWISNDTILSEEGRNTTYETLRLRARAATSEVSLHDLARVLLNINKKRGYKSGRKTNGSEDGNLIDGIQVAKELHAKKITPGQYVCELIRQGKEFIPEFYKSDLISEFESVWEAQRVYYPELLTAEFKNKVSKTGKSGVSSAFKSDYGIYTAQNKGKGSSITAYQWRKDALMSQLDIEKVAYVLADIRGAVENAGGYLGSISDNSKELYFASQTVGEFMMSKLKENPHFSTKNVVFYRQDYIEEFDKIWDEQSKWHNELTPELKSEIRDRTIFYQRRLKSQKGLVGFCEFESHPVSVMIDGKTKQKVCGCRVAPKSSLIFQEFKVWQELNNLVVCSKDGGEYRQLEEEEKFLLSDTLKIRNKMSASEVLKTLCLNPKKWELNFKEIDGNKTTFILFRKFFEVVEASGHGEFDVSKMSYDYAVKCLSQIFGALGFNLEILSFDSSLDKELYEKQPLFRLWHLLYSYEGDASPTGDRSLIEKISSLCGMPDEYARIISTATFPDEYASLSHKAIKKILPYLKAGNQYDVACAYAGYNHSHYLTAEQKNDMPLLDKLPLLEKGSLRNPVVEKIINQMVNVVNQVADVYGKPDEIHIEMARELKRTSSQREKDTAEIAARTKENEKIAAILRDKYGMQYVSKNDILRYRLYEELRENGYKTLYSDRYIPENELFSKNIDIEHIIPQALLFDDSFSNKTLEYRDVNIDKGRRTAKDYVHDKFGEEGYDRYRARVIDLYSRNVISEAKRNKLLMAQNEIPEDFVNRDLSNSQYIAKKAKELLESYVRVVVPTSGAITAHLREQWQLVDVMKELNLPKYEKLDMVSVIDRDGHNVKKIENWTKRNDHRHHAMDAITIAFTKPSYIQLLNTLNASFDLGTEANVLKQKVMIKYGDKLIFEPPMPLNEFRSECKRHLEDILVSIKAKNKVVTRNVNVTKSRNGVNRHICLTPRGALHKEQVYGKRLQYETYFSPVGSRMTWDVVESVADYETRKALSDRLALFGGNAKKAFAGKNSIEKNPVTLANGRLVPAKVKCVRFKEVYSIRKEISPELSIEKVIDRRVRSILTDRLAEFDGDAKKAFSNLDKNPIWLNKEKGIEIKRVTICENFELCALHDKKDKDGQVLTDALGNVVANDYVNLRSNHHIAIYEDAEGNFHENVVPFFEALQRITEGAPVINTDFKQSDGWKFVFSMKINEMFVFPDASDDFFPSEIDLKNPENYSMISRHLFRVQKLSSAYYCFRHHLETDSSSDDLRLKDVAWKRITSINQLKGVVKVRINHAGQIVSVGEYD